MTGIVQNPCCRETIVLHDLDDHYPHGIQQVCRREGASKRK